MKTVRRALVSLSLAVVALVGCSSHTQDQAPRKPHTAYVIQDKRPDTYVTQFNNGFTEAKQDDCEQGFQPACQWLAQVR